MSNKRERERWNSNTGITITHEQAFYPTTKKLRPREREGEIKCVAEREFKQVRVRAWSHIVRGVIGMPQKLPHSTTKSWPVL